MKFSAPSTVALVLFGAACAAAALLIAVIFPRALGGWLVGFVYWSSLPLGALVLAMMIRIIPGRWGDELGGPAEAATLLLPAALPFVLPVLIGIDTLYPWARQVENNFRGLYLAPWSFVLRTLLFFAITIVFAIALLRARRPVAIASAGLILVVLLDTAIAFDWLMSLDPQFHSSGYGLYVLSIQTTIALALLIPAHLLAKPGEKHTGVLGALLLTALLLWAYFAFMQFFIIWSTNLPNGASWYLRRVAGSWPAVVYLYAALHFVPIFLLLFGPIRRSRQWLIGLCMSVLAGKALEVVWLVLPDTGTDAASIIAALLSLAGLGALTGAALPELRRIRERIAAASADRAAAS